MKDPYWVQHSGVDPASHLQLRSQPTINWLQLSDEMLSSQTALCEIIINAIDQDFKGKTSSSQAAYFFSPGIIFEEYAVSGIPIAIKL